MEQRFKNGEPIPEMPVGEIFNYDGIGKMEVMLDKHNKYGCVECGFLLAASMESECFLCENQLCSFCSFDNRNDKKLIYYKIIKDEQDGADNSD